MFWFGLIVSLCYVPGTIGAYIATQWPVLAIVLPFSLLRSGPITGFHWLGIAFVAYAAVLSPFTPAPQGSVMGLWLIIIMALCVWFGTVTEDMRKLYAGLAVGGAVSSGIAVLQYFGTPVVPSVSMTPAGLWVNGVQLGTTLALLIVALVTERMWWYIVPLLPGIALAHSRGGWIALAVGLLACYVRRAWVLAALAVVGAFFFMLPLSGSDTQRVFIWHNALDNLTPFGWGTGVFYNIIMRDINGPFYPEYAHNDAIQLAFEYGFAALAPFAIIGFALANPRVKEWPVVVAFVTAGCYSMPLFMPITAFVALTAVGGVLRRYGIFRRAGSGGRQSGLSWLRAAGGEAVPVASHYSGKGAQCLLSET